MFFNGFKSYVPAFQSLLGGGVLTNQSNQTSITTSAFGGVAISSKYLFAVDNTNSHKFYIASRGGNSVYYPLATNGSFTMANSSPITAIACSDDGLQLFVGQGNYSSSVGIISAFTFNSGTGAYDLVTTYVGNSTSGGVGTTLSCDSSGTYLFTSGTPPFISNALLKFDGSSITFLVRFTDVGSESPPVVPKISKSGNVVLYRAKHLYTRSGDTLVDAGITRTNPSCVNPSGTIIADVVCGTTNSIPTLRVSDSSTATITLPHVYDSILTSMYEQNGTTFLVAAIWDSTYTEHNLLYSTPTSGPLNWTFVRGGRMSGPTNDIVTQPIYAQCIDNTSDGAYYVIGHNTAAVYVTK